MFRTLFRTFRNALAGAFAVLALSGGAAHATADTSTQGYAAAANTGTTGDGLLLGMLLIFAIGWGVFELRRASQS